MTNLHADTYIYDDLLVNTSREIIENGLESPNIPSTIKDWISGHVMRALPGQLVKRLISFVLENRDLDKFIFKENSSGDEFTMLLCRTERQLKTRERHLAEEVQCRELLSENEYNVMFNNTKNLIKNGFDFYTDQLICESSTKVPLINKPSKEFITKREPNFKKNQQIEDFESGTYDENMDIGQKPLPTLVGRVEKSKSIREKNVSKSSEERLALYNEGYKNSKDEGLVNDIDDENWNIVNTACESGYRNWRVYEINSENIEESDSENESESRSKVRKSRINIPSTACCPVCDKIYLGKKKGLWAHMKSQHKAEWPAYWSIHRPKTHAATLLDQYKQYISINSTTGEYVCLECSATFPKPLRMLRHLKNYHFSIKDFKCEQCGKEFTRYDNYKYHLIAHTGQLPYPCCICTKRFLRADKILEHYKCMHPEQYIIEKNNRATKMEEQKQATKERALAKKEAKKIARQIDREKRRRMMPVALQEKLVENSLKNGEISE